VECVVIAIGAGKYDNTDLHRLATPWGTVIIAGERGMCWKIQVRNQMFF
jgi:hypothetical protein